MPNVPVQSVSRCAIYTRKSTDHHLERDFNSLESQQEICSAYITSQRHKGWIELPRVYEDAAQSGGNMDRPAMQDLMRDIEAGLVDVIVIYKIDRLTRSLADFVRLMDVLDRYEVSFASVTQSFDTSDSMGRMILNVLLTFAQFEREMIADRIRDKFAAQRKRGKWTGGTHPLGYDVVDGRLVVNEREAKQVRGVFDRFLQLGSYTAVKKEVQSQGMRTKRWINAKGNPTGGTPVSNGMIYHMLGNCLYVGRVAYQGSEYEGEHEAIISENVWQAAKALRAKRAMFRPCSEPSPNILLGFLCDSHGRRMVIVDERKRARRYRYYMSEQSRWATQENVKRYRCRANELEGLVIASLGEFLTDREQTRRALMELGCGPGELDRLAKDGKASRANLDAASLERVRDILLALITHCEVSRERLKIIVRSSEVARFLEWDGKGIFRGNKSAWRGGEATALIDIPANVVRFERSLVMPIEPIDPHADSKRNPALIALIDEAREAQSIVDTERDKPISELAKRFNRQPGFFSRILRINYLAPDIIASILDGTQPAGLTRQKLLYANLPMDWALQRRLFGFPDRPDHQRSEERY